MCYCSGTDRPFRAVSRGLSFGLRISVGRLDFLRDGIAEMPRSRSFRPRLEAVCWPSWCSLKCHDCLVLATHMCRGAGRSGRVLRPFCPAFVSYCHGHSLLFCARVKYAVKRPGSLRPSVWPLTCSTLSVEARISRRVSDWKSCVCLCIFPPVCFGKNKKNIRPTEAWSGDGRFGRMWPGLRLPCRELNKAKAEPGHVETPLPLRLPLVCSTFK